MSPPAPLAPPAARPTALRHVGAAAALFGFWLLYAWPWLSGAVTIPWDAKSQFWPHYHFLARSFATGESPFWMPQLFAGLAHVADPQALLFSPWFATLAFLDGEPSLERFDAAVLALPLWGGFGVLCWSAYRGLPPSAGLLAGLVFVAGGSVSWRLQHVGQLHSIATLPWLLLALDHAIARGSRLAGAASGLAAAVLLVGRDQVALLGVYLALGFVFARWLEGPDRLSTVRRSLPPLLLGAAIAASLAALPLLWTVLEAGRSNRVAIDLEGAGRGSLHPALLLTLWSPHLFGSGGPMADFWGPPSFAWPDTGLFVAQNMGVLYAGALPLLLLAAAASRLWRSADGPFLLVATGLVLAYALGWYTPLFALAFEHLPGVALYRRPADATFLLAFLLSLLVGRAFALLLADGPSRADLLRALLAAAAGLVAALLLAAARGRLGQAARPLVEAAGWFAAALVGLALCAHGPRRFRAPVLAGLLLLAGLDLVRNQRPNGATGLPVRGEVDWSVLDPSRPGPVIEALRSRIREEEDPARRDRVELVGLGYAWPNAPLVHGLEHTLGHNPVRPARYVAAVGAQDTVAVPEQRPFTAALPSWRSPLADLLGLRWIATPRPIERLDPRLAAEPLPLVGELGGAWIYENPGALPRVRVVGAWRLVEPERLLCCTGWPAVDPRKVVLLEASPAGAPPAGTEPGRARIEAYRQGEVVVEAEADAGGFLVLHDAWHPWWRAELDGRPVPILRADLLFRAVVLPPGRHRVTFRFAPLAGALAELAERL